jgi:hypothetical protein
MRFLLLFTSLSCWAQTILPNWAGAGVEYGSSSPHFSGWAAMALPVSSSAQAYSFTMYQALPVAGKVPTISTTTGLATILRTFEIKKAYWGKGQGGTIYFIGLGTAGVATSSSSTTAAFAGGGGGVWKFPSGFTLEVFAIQNKAGSSAKPNVLAGGGWTW